MKLNEAQTQKLMEYKGRLDIKQLVLSLAITKNRLSYLKDNSPSSLTAITQNLNSILAKYESAVQADFQLMTNIQEMKQSV